MYPVQVIELGMSADDLSPRARQIIREAEVLVGGRRLLDYFPDHPGLKVTLGKDLEWTLKQIPPLAERKRVAVLVSGDPNFYGAGPLVVKLFGAERVVLHPNITAVQAACALLKIPWHDAALVSLHGRSWTALEEALPRARKLILYTDPEHTPAGIARVLLARGHAGARLCVLEDLGRETERLSWLSPDEAEAREFSPLNVVVVLLEPAASPAAPPLRLGLPEEAFSHQAGLITKAEVRAVVLARLELSPGLVLWDVGAGCGSVGLEASLLMPGGRILAVEQDPERARQIAANREKFGVDNLEVVCGRAPECLAALPSPQRVFIGGGGAGLAAILREVLGRLEPGGRVVLSAALLESLETARAVFKEAGWSTEVTHLQVSRSRPLAGGAAMQALNPVWIVTAAPG